MPIVVNLDVVMATRKVRSIELASAIGISETNLSLLKSGKVKGVKFSTIEAICEYLECQPGDLLEYVHAGSPEQMDDVEPPGGTRQPPVRRLRAIRRRSAVDAPAEPVAG